MPIIAADYQPSFPFRNGHINTVYSSLFRKIKPLPFVRKRIETADDDFLDIDFLENGSEKIVILCHGLEGSSSSKYIQATARLLHANGYAIAAMNYRFCSGEINRQLITYHSGRTEDLNTVINLVLPHYTAVYLVGFSLGGNLVLKYSGDGLYPMHTKIKATVGISVPVDLHGSSLVLQKPKNKLYTWRFLITLAKKIRLKHKQYPEQVDVSLLKKVKKLIDFDEHYTSKLNGFSDAKDYYAKANCKQFLSSIKLPALLINALDDPFLSASCFPYAEAEKNKNFSLMTPSHGGHVGFVSSGREYYWVEKEILSFIDKN
ncbi:alpha/beta fold hydrolase [Flavobacteriaceae bacterium]|nr:alpha/beta fold hydrolase [Flavobacteriaceae bacterium]